MTRVFIDTFQISYSTEKSSRKKQYLAGSEGLSCGRDQRIRLSHTISHVRIARQVEILHQRRHRFLRHPKIDGSRGDYEVGFVGETSNVIT